MKYQQSIDTPIGVLHILTDESGILGISPVPYCTEYQETPNGNICVKLLEKYFNGEKVDLSLISISNNIEGTNFRKKVWCALSRIPYGTTLTYGELAKIIGSPKAARAVGQANHFNPIPIIIPCHRIIASGGNIGGYGLGIEIKRKLLSIEGINFI